MAFKSKTQRARRGAGEWRATGQPWSTTASRPRCDGDAAARCCPLSSVLALQVFNPSTALTTYGSPDLVVQLGSDPYTDMRSLFWERLIVQVKLHDAYMWSSGALITLDCQLFTGSVGWDTEVSGLDHVEPR